MSAPSAVAAVSIGSVPAVPSSSSSSSLLAASSQLLTRSILGDELVRSRASSTQSTPGGNEPPEPPSPSSTSSRSRRTSHSSRHGATTGIDGGEHGLDGALIEPPVANLHELSDLLRELHRNQLWFIYVFSSAREQFQNGNQKQMEQLSQTLSDLHLAVESAQRSKKRMADIERRTEAMKKKIEGWRIKQLTQDGQSSSAPAAEQL